MNQTAKGPKYLLSFRCIGAACIDNCCIGWDVDFDQSAYEKYKKVQDKVLKPIIQKHVYVKKHPYDPAIDFAGVRLKKGKRCPFLDAENWCQIQSIKGEEALSNVCWHFPRYLNQLGKFYEVSATLSCPVVAELLLRQKNGLQLKDIPMNPQRRLLTYQLSETEYSKYAVHRTEALANLSDYSRTLEERLLSIGEIKRPKMDHTTYRLAQKNVLDWIGYLNPTDEAHSSRYALYAQEMVCGLALKKNHQQWQLSWTLLNQGLRTYALPYIQSYPTTLSNYFEHYYFKTVYPYSETTNQRTLHALSLVLYSLIVLHLAGIGLNRGKLDEEDVILFLSASTKAVEHHYTFFDQVIYDFQSKPLLQWWTIQDWLEGIDLFEGDTL